MRVEEWGEMLVIHSSLFMLLNKRACAKPKVSLAGAAGWSEPDPTAHHKDSADPPGTRWAAEQ